MQLGPHGGVDGYLNATPRSGEETIGNWTSFRIHHNAEEGDRLGRMIAGANGLRVGRTRASCVIDDYLTSSAPAHSYREVACLIDTPRGVTAVVGASSSRAWTRQRPVLERAIAGFLAS